MFRQAEFITGARKTTYFPPDEGVEVAFAGRSNAGKSSALNTLTGRKRLARVSKTPGRTREINFFDLGEQRRLVDLPGYGYAKVSAGIKNQWLDTVNRYLRDRQSLRGLVLLTDCRRPPSEMDTELLDWCVEARLPVHMLLTKSDKIKRGKARQALDLVKNGLGATDGLVTVQLFSSFKRDGLDQLRARLTEWLS